jgi:hypothetical protein
VARGGGGGQPFGLLVGSYLIRMDAEAVAYGQGPSVVRFPNAADGHLDVFGATGGHEQPRPSTSSSGNLRHSQPPETECTEFPGRLQRRSRAASSARDPADDAMVADGADLAFSTHFGTLTLTESP